MSDARFTVENRPDEQRYVLIDHEAADAVIGEEAYVDVDDDRVLFHTLVSDDYGGQGLASRLVTEVVDDLIAQGKHLVPVCPYVKAWLPKHHEYDEHVVQPTRAHLQAVRDRTR